MNTALLIVKYSASLLMGAYGLYATVTDFHEQKNGERVLSRRGRLGIVLLLVGTVLNLSSDGLKDFRARREAKVEEQKRLNRETEERKTSAAVAASLANSVTAAKLLDAALDKLRTTSDVVTRNSITTENALREAQRAVYTFSLKNLALSAILHIAPPTKKPDLADRANETMLKISFRRRGWMDESGRWKIEYPVALKTDTLEGGVVAILDDPFPGDLNLSARCTDEPVRDFPVTLDFFSEFPEVVTCHTEHVDVDWDDGKFRSLVDLIGATVIVTFVNVDHPSLSSSLEVKKMRLYLTTNEGRSLHLNLDRVEDRGGGVVPATDPSDRFNGLFVSTVTAKDLSIKDATPREAKR